MSSLLFISVHIEFHPVNQSLSYLLIYKFDQIPQLNFSTSQIDDWTIICPSSLANEGIYTHFLDNILAQNQQSLVFCLRELNSSESLTYCSNSPQIDPPIQNLRYNFTWNYELRIYTSGCYYFNKNNEWKDEGLRVGPKTNHNQNQCFSNHL